MSRSYSTGSLSPYAGRFARTCSGVPALYFPPAPYRFKFHPGGKTLIESSPQEARKKNESSRWNDPGRSPRKARQPCHE